MMKLVGRRTPIGVDVGARTIAAAQLTAGRGLLPRLDAAAVLERPRDSHPVLSADEAKRVIQALHRQGFAGEDVVFAVPVQRTISTVLELPPRSSGAPVDQLAAMEVARAHRLDPGSFEMAWWEIPPPTRAAPGAHVMVVACRHADADELMSGPESAGLRVQALDCRAWVAARAACLGLAEDETLSAVLDLSESAAVLTIIHDGTPVYERLLSDGALELVRVGIRNKLGVESEVADHVFAGLRLQQEGDRSDDLLSAASALLGEHLDALAAELRTAVAYAEHRFSGEIRRVLLHGQGAAIPGVAGHLSGLLNASAAAVMPADLVSVAQGVRDSVCTPMLFGAIGLALHSSGAEGAVGRREAA